MKGLRRTNSAGARLTVIGMVLVATLGGAQAADRVWTGTANGAWFWSNANNWGGIAPADLDALFFAGPTGLANTNDFLGTNTYRSLTFSSGAGAFRLEGGPLIVLNGITNGTPLTQTVNLGLQVGNLALYTAPGGTLVLNGISGPGRLTKAGTGTLRLKGPVTSTGPLAVNAGALLVDGVVTGPSSVSVRSGGTLGGSGFIARDLFLADGATLSPGTNNTGAPATLTCSNLALNPNTVIRLDLNVPGMLGGSNDLIVAHGDLTLSGILKATSNAPAGIYPIIKYDGALTDHGMQLGSGITGTLLIDPTNKLISVNASAFPTSPPAPMRVLFIGNSLTGAHDIPGTVRRMANAAGDLLTYRAEIVGGFRLADHVTNQVAVPLIDSGNYDLVILQEQSFTPSTPYYRTNFMQPAARVLNSHIASHGARAMFYQTWGYPNGDPWHCGQYDTPLQYRACDWLGMLVAVRMGYALIADELNAAISPVGLAFLTVLTERPDINLYMPPLGEYHPDATGAYLAACVHYASILGRSPVGSPHFGDLTNGYPAAYLQSVAERTVFGDPWANDPFGFAPNRYYWTYGWSNYTNRSFTRLNGVVISASGSLPSPSVKLDAAAGPTSNVYLGVYDYEYQAAGEGRLFLRPGGSLSLAGAMVVGKEGRGWVQHDGGGLVVSGALAIAEQPSSSGAYTLNSGTLAAAGLTVGQGGQGAVQQNGGDSQVLGVLTLAEQPSSSGAYTLAGGTLSASRIERGQGSALFTVSGGQLRFDQFGSAGNPFDLAQTGGSLAPSNTATIFGDYSLGAAATLEVVLGTNTNPRVVAAGTVTLAGRLSLSFAPGLAPAAGQQILLVAGGAVSGRFSQVITPPGLPDGSLLLVYYTATSVVATVAAPVPPDLLAWWPGDGTADDLAGTNDGTLMGGATASLAGTVGQAFAFDGTNAYVQIPDSPQLRPTNFTLEGWVLFTSLDSAGAGGSPAGQQYIVFKQNSRDSFFEGYQLGKARTADGDVFSFTVSSAAGQAVTLRSATRVSTSVWYHVTAARGSNVTRLYLNGQLESQTNVSFAQDYGNHPLFFGTSGQTYWDHKFAGRLDEVSLYGRVLSAQEIGSIYAAGPAGKCREAAVTVQPNDQTVLAGLDASFTASALGPVRTYQWFYNGTNALTGATNRTLLLTNLNLSQSGHYSVVAGNAAGSVVSQPASLQVAPIVGIVMPIRLSGTVGSTWRIDYVNDLAPSNNWVTLATVTLTNTSQFYLDTSALGQPHRFYRVVPLP